MVALQTAIVYTAAFAAWAFALGLYVCFVVAACRLAQRYL